MKEITEQYLPFFTQFTSRNEGKKKHVLLQQKTSRTEMPLKVLKLRLNGAKTNLLREVITNLKMEALNTNLTLNRTLIKSCSETAETSALQS